MTIASHRSEREREEGAEGVVEAEEVIWDNVLRIE
jgi:hypothetical protein